MDVANLLTDHDPQYLGQSETNSQGSQPQRFYNDLSANYQGTDSSALTNIMGSMVHDTALSGSVQQKSHNPSADSPAKTVTFELLLDDGPQHRARLPMRVNIWPHDTTESIITTVKNFYGLYDWNGVSFEDKQGITLIARYENFENGMVVLVRVIPPAAGGPNEYSHARESLSPRKPRLGEPFQMQPQHPGSRPSSRTARRRSRSPSSRHDRRSASTNTVTKGRSRPGPKSRTGSMHGSVAEIHGDLVNDYSDSDGGNASVTSSRRGKSEQVASAEISLDNIVEGGRRKRAKFDSSELPLFVPPQVPMSASISSVSPQRRIGSHNGASPYSYYNQHTFSYPQPLPSPQSYGQSEVSYMQGIQMGTPYSGTSGQPHGLRARTRGSAQYPPRYSNGGILPTPDPTVGSVISDEDVALQLMRLGDASNFSSHGRTSTSTLDDALSGKAEVASSEEESEDGSDDEADLPGYPASLPMKSGMNNVGELPHSFDSAETSGDEYFDNRDESFKGESDDIVPDEHDATKHKGLKSKATSGIVATKSRAGSVKSTGKGSKPRTNGIKSKSKGTASGKAPISPASLPSQSRKTSSASVNFQHQLGADEEDLSTKPRCQRCRKSKKGCDRQRPCQRCKDAGIGIEGCISEDEGNGRKGRYGRHMGVPVKKTASDIAGSPPAPTIGTVLGSMAAPPTLPDKSKKRKR